MRADRLVAVLLLMQSRGRVTAAELATELQVSVATARRDLEALSTAGVPVYPQPGRGGGWSLVGGARTDLSGLTAAEARALFLLARARPRPFRPRPERRCANWCGRCPDLPGRRRGRRRRVVIDPVALGRARPSPAGPWSNAADRVIRRRKVRLTYAGRPREPAERLVDPWGLVDKDDIWYLLAGTDRGRRTFRVDRIDPGRVDRRARRTPRRLRLAAAWQEVVDEMEQRRSRAWATVLIDGAVRAHAARPVRAGTATPTVEPTTGGPGSASPHRPRWTSPDTWPAGAPASRWSSRAPSATSSPASAPSCPSAIRGGRDDRVRTPRCTARPVGSAVRVARAPAGDAARTAPPGRRVGPCTRIRVTTSGPSSARIRVISVGSMPRSCIAHAVDSAARVSSPPRRLTGWQRAASSRRRSVPAGQHGRRGGGRLPAAVGHQSPDQGTERLRVPRVRTGARSSRRGGPRPRTAAVPATRRAPRTRGARRDAARAESSAARPRSAYRVIHSFHSARPQASQPVRWLVDQATWPHRTRRTCPSPTS